MAYCTWLVPSSNFLDTTPLVCRLDSLDSCQVSLVLASELLVDAELIDLLPLNSLRNLALLHSKTPLVFIGDGGSCSGEAPPTRKTDQ